MHRFGFVALCLCACSLSSLILGDAEAGETDVDIEVAVMGWSGEPSSNDRIYLRKWIDEDFSQDEITFGDFDDLVAAAGTSCSVLASEATSVHGSWYTQMATADKTKYCDLFTRIADSD
jgi:hypothetical protein